MGNANSVTTAIPEHQSVAIESDFIYSDSTATHRSFLSPDSLISNRAGAPYYNCWDLFTRAGRDEPSSRKLPLYGHRKKGVGPYLWISRAAAEKACHEMAGGIMHMKLCPEIFYPAETLPAARNVRTVGIFMKNCVEWVILENACHLVGITLVPLYDTLGAEAMTYICETTKISTVFLTRETLPKIINIRQSLTFLQNIVISDSVEAAAEDCTAFSRLLAETKNILIESNLNILLWDTLLVEGSKNPINPSIDVTLDTLSTICYTSGTTGIPKGVMITHGNIVASVAGVLNGSFLDPALGIQAGDVHMSYLPLSHIYERVLCCLFTSRNASIGFYGGDTAKLLEDVVELQPTLFISVPRLYNRIHDKVIAGVALKNAALRSLFNAGLDAKISRMRKTGIATHKFWDAVVFRKTKNLLGGRLRYLVSGGAPLDSVVEERIKVLFGCQLIQGYGLTESLGPTFMSLVGDPSSGHVGSPSPSFEFRLISVPELGHFATGETPSGEVLLRGPALCHGYFNAPKLTEEVFSKDGWFSTGDVGLLLPNGSLKIIDRRKNLFKLSQGEYISPERIEGICSIASLVGQIMVTGLSTKSFLVALVYSEPDAVSFWARNNILSSGEKALGKAYDDIVKDNAFKTAVLNEITCVLETAKVCGFEKIKNLRLVPEPFSVENGLTTPTLKIKRNQAESVFKNEVVDMYNELEK